MNEQHKPPGARMWRPDYDAQNASARLFVPVSAETLERLSTAARARNVSVAVVAAEWLERAAG